MKRTTLRSAGITALAAVTIGVAAPTALAATEDNRRTVVAGIDDPTPEDLHVITPEEAQEAAQSLLDSDEAEVQELLQSLDTEELADLQAVAEGQSAQALQVNWGKIWKVLKKIGGFAKAVKGSYSKFKKWYNGLPWWSKALIRTATVGVQLYDVYWHFHNVGVAPEKEAAAKS
ncbi:hypothetical protein [Streptomyces sp. I05A-00742]|uniref:hypothetical protein n=1 Tax=Streptomyces sp. I05A-00742 TaxID=2732853 RepID=UPI001489D049|nr:hypothetical protein [Streptomyces sp. I05A-00742]